MPEYHFYNLLFEADEQAARDWYAKFEGWDCTCGHCRNFLALAHARMLPAPVLDILDRLGIPPEQATYVCELSPEGDGHLYQFSYRIPGRVLSGDGAAVLQDWGRACCCHEPYPYAAPGFPPPHFDLEFYVSLPWVLEEPDR